MEYATELEMRMLKEKREIEKRLGKTGRYKPLLYETGETLEKLVINAFQEVDISVNKLSSESYVDFELQISEDVVGVCEVKGLTGSANIRHLRQLLQYYIEQRDIEKRNIKGIFIVNHFRDTNPKERGDALTKDAWDVVRKHNFKVITTAELYTKLVMFFENKITKEEVIKELCKTTSR